eukprot:gnl/MRDRNA2_/MRDRNA2_35805_c0_seq1.p1 gnl/MRDRNA2_/MRDRNA2_35805_c0~~gnl/MRDRNA2_/MRDRNA2_35805_c0_seq1.p1  ORF type:complete len:627 (+),score=76.65 gnl/MRDRNA2_/MRDRNA2_35805_c0_seq1:116-1996(+)
MDCGQDSEHHVLPVTHSHKKKKCSLRPRRSIQSRVQPCNLSFAMESFFASGESVAPEFRYKGKSKDFEKHSSVNFSFYDDAVHIIEKVIQEYGSPAEFAKHAYGSEMCSAEEFRDAAVAYLHRLGIENKAEVRVTSMPLAMASVSSAGKDSKHIVSITNSPVPRKMITNILDHEIGTHLLRMMNEEQQVWYHCRKKHGLRGHWSTEEGLAMLNSLLSMDIKYLWSAALRYWTVCQASCLGFVELYHKLKPYVVDHKRCFRCCVRAKRGLRDTSLPGAFNSDQMYFLGAMRILRSIDHIDFRLLYCGSIAIEDLPRICFMARRQLVRLPLFLRGDEDLSWYRRQLHAIRKANGIETKPLPCLRRLSGPRFQFRYAWKESVRKTSVSAETSAVSDSLEEDSEDSEDDSIPDSDEPSVDESRGLFSDHGLLLEQTKKGTKNFRPGLFFTPLSNPVPLSSPLTNMTSPTPVAQNDRRPASSKPKALKAFARRSVSSRKLSLDGSKPNLKAASNTSTAGRKPSINNDASSGRLSLRSGARRMTRSSSAPAGKLSITHTAIAQKLPLNSNTSVATSGRKPGKVASGRKPGKAASSQSYLAATNSRRQTRKSVPVVNRVERRSSIFRSPLTTN